MSGIRRQHEDLPVSKHAQHANKRGGNTIKNGPGEMTWAPKNAVEGKRGRGREGERWNGKQGYEKKEREWKERMRGGDEGERREEEN